MLPDDRLALAGSDLVTYGSTFLNLWELEQGDDITIRNTEVTGLDRGRPEIPAIEARKVTLAGHVAGDVDLVLPTPNEHANPKVGVRENWRALVAIFEQQFDVDTLEMDWQRRVMAGGWETLTADVQVANWQITKAWPTAFAFTVEVTRFTEWVEGS